MHQGDLLYSVFYLQIGCFLKWACLDSNQGPLPYQCGTQSFSHSSQGVAYGRQFRLFMLNSPF